MNSYICNDWVIVRGEYGADQGLAWALFRNGQFIADGFRTLKSAQKHAAFLGQSGMWQKSKIIHQTVE